MEEDDFKLLFRRIVEKYQLSPETAALLLQRILSVLADTWIDEPINLSETERKNVSHDHIYGGIGGTGPQA